MFHYNKENLNINTILYDMGEAFFSLFIAIVFEAIADSILIRFKKVSRINAFFILGISVFILGLNLETVREFTSYMYIMLLLLILVEATLGAITWFYIMDENLLLEEINKSTRFQYKEKWYKLGRYVFVPISFILTVIAIATTIAY